MPNVLHEVETGLQRLKDAMPNVATPRISELRMVEAKGNVLTVQDRETGASYRLAWAPGQTFKQLTGADPFMMGKLSPELQEQIWAELLGRNQQKMTIKYRGGSDAHEVLAVMGNDQPTVNYKEWTDRIVDHLGPEGIANIAHLKAGFGFGLVFEEAKGPAKDVNDIVHSGVYINMNGKVTAQPYHLRRTCTNGATAPTFSTREYTLSEDTYRRGLDEMRVESQSFRDAFLDLANQPMGSAGGHIGALRTGHILNTQQTAQLVTQIQVLPDDASLYDLANLITAQQHANPNDIRWLEIGGQAIQHFHSGVCTHCGHH